MLRISDCAHPYFVPEQYRSWQGNTWKITDEFRQKLHVVGFDHFTAYWHSLFQIDSNDRLRSTMVLDFKSPEHLVWLKLIL